MLDGTGHCNHGVARGAVMSTRIYSSAKHLGEVTQEAIAEFKSTGMVSHVADDGSVGCYDPRAYWDEHDFDCWVAEHGVLPPRPLPDKAAS